MKEIKDVKSQSKPEEFEENDTTVFVRSNIREDIEEDPVFKTKETVYVYDEIQYTIQEYFAITIKELKDEISELRTELNALKYEVEN